MGFFHEMLGEIVKVSMARAVFFAGLEVRMRVKVRVAIFFFPSRGGECKT